MTRPAAASRESFFDDPRLLAPRQVERVARADGGFVLRSTEPLRAGARRVGDWLEHWARERPDAAAFAEPAAGGGWTTLSWSALRGRVGAVAQALLDLRLPGARPVVVLSDNSLDHLVLLLAGMHVGRPVCTVSSGYCRLAAGDYTRIHGILHQLDPALVYAHDAATYAPALRDAPVRPPLVFSHGADSVAGATAFAQLAATVETAAVMRAFDSVTPDTHAKYLLTSGSTGHPKVVINTHRMLTANQQQLAQTFRFIAHDGAPVLLDWLPWSHTFGGNHNTNLVLAHGGTMVIDDGRPLPGAIDKTIAHLREVQPTVYFNVPRGYEMMLPALEADADLARRFFARLRMVFYAGSAMPLATWQRLEAVAARVRDEPVWFTTSWGSTETAPAVTSVHWHIDKPGVIGLPLPGVELKFAPIEGEHRKFELRVRGPNVFPGYLGDEAATRAAFDDEGFYRIGDAGHLADESDPVQGVMFDGRVAEDFKLTSGTWVSVGLLRVRLVSALAPLAQDAVITGHERSEVGALVFLSEAGRKTAPEALRERVREALRALAAESGGASSQAPTRALILPDAPSMAAGEITDKGYINQRLTLQRRTADVELLYAETSDPCVIRLHEEIDR